MFAVIEQSKIVLFQDVTQARAYALSLEAWFNDHAPAGAIGPCPDLYPVEATANLLRFTPAEPDRSLEAGPGQSGDPEISQAIAQWWAARERHDKYFEPTENDKRLQAFSEDLEALFKEYAYYVEHRDCLVTAFTGTEEMLLSKIRNLAYPHVIHSSTLDKRLGL